MNIEIFEQKARNTGRTQKELLNLLHNAHEKNKPDYAVVVEDVLNERYPDWESDCQKKGGARPTVVRFKSEEKAFPSGKTAYFWMIENFINNYPSIFNEINWETIFVAKGTKRLYFGRSLKKVFFGSPHLAEDSNNYSKLTNGWYVNLNLSNDQKLDILFKVAAVAKLDFEKDWSWQVLP